MQEFPSETAMSGHPRKTRLKRAFAARGTALLVALLCACDNPPAKADSPTPVGALTAENIQQIQVLHISSGECSSVLRENLRSEGLQIHEAGPADASLRLTLSSKRPLREHLPIIKQFGWQAHYRAEFIGAKDRILLSVFGQEGSLTMNELCDDIGDEIANKLGEYIESQSP